MYRTGIAHRRSYAIIALIAAIAVAAWLIQAQLGNSTKSTPANKAAAAAPAPAANEQGVNQQAPQTTENGANAQAPSGSAAGGGYGDYGTGNGGTAAGATVVVHKSKSLTAKKIAKMGEVVVDDEGFILYRFDKDSPNPPGSTCVEACAVKWPPIELEEGATISGIDTSKVGKITRPDGAAQVTLGNWALYRYSGDTKPGTWKGQGVGGTWFVSAPDGKKNLTCLPSTPPAP